MVRKRNLLFVVEVKRSSGVTRGKKLKTELQIETVLKTETELRTETENKLKTLFTM